MKTKLAILTLAAMLAGCGKPNSDEVVTRFAVGVVSNSLISPSTAKFSSVRTMGTHNRLVIVRGLVDAQNVYGGTLRQEWLVVVTNPATREMQWVTMELDEKVTENDLLRP